MIDMLAVIVPHLVMALAVWRLVQRDDLDEDQALPIAKRPGAAGQKAGPGKRA